MIRLRIEVALHYRFTVANTLFLALEAAETSGQTLILSQLTLPGARLTRIAGDARVGQRIWAEQPEGDMRLSYSAEVGIDRAPMVPEGWTRAPRHRLPADVAPYLRPSRYCQSDKFVAFVQKEFGALQGGPRVAAIRDWIEAHLSYVPGASDADTNVLETFAARQGVCRDYAHLLCTMVRAAGIPARMVAAYSPGVTPPDFHAVAQVWLEDSQGTGHWHLLDATGMSTPQDTAITAVGRDAYDIAFMDSEAPAELVSQSVSVTRAP